MATEPIYPVPVKPSSGITNWGQWPRDVEPTIWRWNKGKGLSFGWDHRRVFKCVDCEQFCRQYLRAVLNGDALCDDCLIARARAVAEGTEAPLSPPFSHDKGDS